METPDTRDLSDRELLLATYHTVQSIDGRVQKHDTDLYGDPARGIDGALPLVRSNRDRLDDYDDLKNRYIGIGVGLGGITGLLGGWFGGGIR